ncbi:SusD/RagB family nutrient-binding outer membrane lipoprotein [Daejeonella sp.]|uniref:SusD/RagB family nutrient-binding outer membrane lipoprotein n=1 Tax=Daejeonella sp. TaxID=2805397 RepID=UPI0030C1D689
MQKIYKYTLILAMAATLVFPSCGKEYFDELSANPNQVNDPTLPALLATATSKAGLRTFDAGSVINPYVQYTANPTAGAASDIYETIDFTGTWDAMYFAMSDINEMKKLATKNNSTEYLGVANLLFAYHLIIVNNFWGAAPFSQAFNPSNFTPKYDTDQEIYAASMKLVDDAITELSKTTATDKLVAASDLIHGGDRAKWLRTAYAIKARLLIKASKTPAFNAAAVLTALGNSYTSNTDDAGMATFTLRNSWAQVSRNNAALSLGGWLSEQFIDHLNGTTYGIFDPRLPKITDVTVVPNNPAYPKYIGTVNGAGNRLNPPHNNTVKDENYISFNSPWTNDTAPIWIVTFAELKFIEAEAAFATDKPRAYQAYIDGIKANMLKYGLTTTESEPYVTSVSVGAANLTLALIFKEKYIATYLNPEAWNDARRHNYGYKDFGLPLNAVLPTFIRRLDYPIGERSKNGTNVPAGSLRTARLWWDL